MASDREAGNKVYERVSEGDGIVRSAEPRKFDLFFAAASQRVSFAVTQSAAGDWTVQETVRSAYKLTRARSNVEDSSQAAAQATEAHRASHAP